ncbi:MAG TPA: SDR family oxidoreductase [Bacteroidales bacterium]|nr:SDR family oxidoreductase [Bacteroidales bacterium]
MQKSNPKKEIFKKQTQDLPGLEKKMDPRPEFDNELEGKNRLNGKKCIITGGDSGIGRAVAIAFAKEGADVAIIHLPAEKEDSEFTVKYISEKYNRKCISVATDISSEANCRKAVEDIVAVFGRVDVLVNNAAVQYPMDDFLKITTQNLVETFSVNIFAMFWLTQGVIPYMTKGSVIINTTSVTAYRGSSSLVDYSSTKGAIVSFTRSLSANLVDKGIRVNAVAPGPVWTPLIPATFDEEHVQKFGTDVPMKRPGQPVEVAPAYVFLAGRDSDYITGQVIHVNGGEIING